MSLRGGKYREVQEDAAGEAELQNTAKVRFMEEVQRDIVETEEHERMMQQAEAEAKTAQQGGGEGFSQEDQSFEGENADVMTTETRDVDDKMWEAAEECNLRAFQVAFFLFWCQSLCILCIYIYIYIYIYVYIYT